MPRELLAVLLAILVANPACCCTIASLLDVSREKVTPVSSCCSGQQTPSPDEAPCPPDEDPSCPCATDDPVLVEAKLSPFDWLGADQFGLEVPPSHEAARHAFSRLPWIADWENPPPREASWRLHCRYLL